jgi:hypothetical protein
MYWDITKIEYLYGYRLKLIFKSGESGEVDLSKYASYGGVFTRFAGLDYFQQVSIDHGVLTWPGNVDIAPETIYSMATGKPLPEWMESFFVDEGFLSGEMNSIRKSIRSKYISFFELAEEINRFCIKVNKSIEIHDKDIQEILSASLYLRILETFESILILAERGLVTQVKMLLRCMIESVCLLSSVVKDYEFTVKYINHDEYFQRLRILNILKETNPSPIKEIEKKIELLKSEIKQKGIKKIRSEDVLDFSGLKQCYNSAFFVFSESSHSNSRDMEGYLRVEDELIKEFIFRPNIERMDAVIYTAIDGLMIALDRINNLFSLNIYEDLKTFDEKMKKLEIEKLEVNNMDRQ